MNEYWTLGDLIDALKQRKQDQSVAFDFGYFVPCYLGSWRGVYAHLAIGYANQGYDTVADFLRDLEKAVGADFQGWKGGDYVMTRSTPVWVANSGDANNTAVVGIARCDYQTIIRTDWREW
jgi:hypothetical protein